MDLGFFGLNFQKMGKEWLGEQSGDKSTGEGSTGAKTGQSELIEAS